MTDDIIRGPGRPRKQDAVPLGSTAAPYIAGNGPQQVVQKPAEIQPETDSGPTRRRRRASTGGHSETDSGPTRRRRRASTGGHSLKLAAPQRAGYSRRWVNDDGNRLAAAHELGYDHVNEDGVQTSDLGSRISRLVGTKANGEPLRAYLMETPDELYAQGLSEKEAHNRQVDDAIAAGRDSTGQMVPTETYGHGLIQQGR